MIGELNKQLKLIRHVPISRFLVLNYQNWLTIDQKHEWCIYCHETTEIPLESQVSHQMDPKIWLENQIND